MGFGFAFFGLVAWVFRFRAHFLKPHLVEVVPAELAVPGRRDDLGDAAAHLQHRNVESSAAEVEHQDQLVTALRMEGWETVRPRAVRTLGRCFGIGKGSIRLQSGIRNAVFVKAS